MFSLDNNNDSEDSNAALELAARTFKDLQDEYYEIYKMYNLSDLVIPLVIPLVSNNCIFILLILYCIKVVCY